MQRVGQGIDVHPFDEARPLILGGVRIAERGGLAGHSDADVVLHAVTDALLGAIGAGDIGEHFPSSDERWKGAASTVFVREAVRLVRDQNAVLQNLDLTIVAEKPRLAPWKEKIRETLAEMLGVRAGQVNVKATTTDGLGFTGRGEGIAAMAIVSIGSDSGQL